MVCEDLCCDLLYFGNKNLADFNVILYFFRRPFYVTDSQVKGSGEVLQVLMMVNGGDFPYNSDPVLGCQVVGLPYKDRSATMYLVLPDEPGYQALRRLQYKFTVNRLKELADSATERTVIIAVPKMQLESTTYLKEALKVLGIHTLFDPFEADLSQISDYRDVDSFMTTDRLGEKNMTEEENTSTDNITSTTHLYPEHTTINTNVSIDEMSKESIYQTGSEKERTPKHIRINSLNINPKISRNPGLYADSIIHKVTIDVTESGTEAAAATVVSVTRDGSHKVVRFDRPFLFFIRHEETGAVLFWGTVVKPTPNRIMSSVK
jgi:serine protease inhibitor